ncbi:MAG TPA: glycosyltransferase family 4 protein [Bacteroidales bacterium]|jgi:hypothetical protein|nr:glycosyltransferase family 4 protein [Bacteroidales bacterium]HQJ81481.1 glycosyltransferase family 4 protein [Bacteroidales bacterium]
MNRVLIITYYWPPSGGAGVQRWLKFAGYLPSYGWEPVILTVDPQYASYPQRDESLLKKVPPAAEVITTKSSGGIFRAYRMLTGSPEVPYGGFANEDDPGFLQRLSRFIRGNFVLPDARKGWNKHALEKAVEIIKTGNIRAVITTSPPHSTQLTGLKLKESLNIKWIADLRDPWSEIYYSRRMYQTSLARRINLSVERKVLNAADRVIATCNATADLFRSKLADGQLPEKVITVTNGYDPGDFKHMNAVPESFAITYLGTFAADYDAETFSDAADYFTAHSSGVINLRFIGKTDSRTERLFSGRKNLNLQVMPYAEHDKALEYLAGSAALLLVVPSGSKETEMIPGKLFEYLASKRRIIALGPEDSDVADILRKTGGGRIFSRGDSAELGKYLISLYDDFKNGNFEAASAGLEEYSRPALAEKIAAVLNSL